MNQTHKIGSRSFSVTVREMPPFVVGEWAGAALDSARETAQEAVGALLGRTCERLVLELGGLREISDTVAASLARLITEAQRRGRNVCLVRCPEDLFRRLQRAGMGGTVRHAVSLPAATDGLLGDPTGALELHLRSTPELLPRLRSVVAALAQEAGLAESTELELKMAVTEAAANAIRHGSPEGPRNHVHISFHVDPSKLIVVDVSDQGPGFDPAAIPAPRPADGLSELREGGFGLVMMRRSMDRLEFYQDDRGMLVRMTKYLRPREAGSMQ